MFSRRFVMNRRLFLFFYAVGRLLALALGVNGLKWRYRWSLAVVVFKLWSASWSVIGIATFPWSIVCSLGRLADIRSP